MKLLAMRLINGVDMNKWKIVEIIVLSTFAKKLYNSTLVKNV